MLKLAYVVSCNFGKNFYNNLGSNSDGSNGSIFSWVLINSGCPNVAAATYFVHRYEVYKDVNFPYSASPLLTVTANGFSTANPNNGSYWAHARNVTNTSARLRTFTYNLISSSGQSIGWVPAHPTDVKFNYHVVDAVTVNVFLQNQTESVGTNIYNAIRLESGRNLTNSIPIGNCVVEGSAMAIRIFRVYLVMLVDAEKP